MTSRRAGALALALLLSCAWWQRRDPDLVAVADGLDAAFTAWHDAALAGGEDPDRLRALDARWQDLHAALLAAAEAVEATRDARDGAETAAEVEERATAHLFALDRWRVAYLAAVEFLRGL